MKVRREGMTEALLFKFKDKVDTERRKICLRENDNV